MKSFMVVAAVLGLVAADVSHLTGGYQYRVPQTSYGVPTHHGSSSYNSYKGSQGQVSQFGQQSGANYQTASQGHHNANQGYHNANQGYQNAGQFGSQAGQYQGAHYHGNQQSGYQGVGNAQSGYQSVGQYQSAGQALAGLQAPSQGYYQPQSGQAGQAYQQKYQSSSAQKYQHEYYAQQQPAQIFKHFYVHAAPEEPEQVRVRTPVVIPAPQKHYKIIFIKTPSVAPSAPQLVPVQQQNEEKTIVYVLVQKPEEAADVVLPPVEQKPPTKPEVYFIKYNNKEGSQAVINNIVNDLNQGQAVSSTAGNTGTAATASFSQSFTSGQSTPVAQDQVFVQDHSGVSENEHHHHHQHDEQSNAGSESSTFNSGYQGGSSVTTVGYQNNEVAQNVYQSEENQQQGSQLISTSQGVPHESYGPPKFRLH